MMKLSHRPISLKEANRFVGIEHRHAKPVRGYRWALGAYACELYDRELYAGWERTTKEARADGGKARTEVLWTKPAGVRMPAPRGLIQSNLALGDA